MSFSSTVSSGEFQRVSDVAKQLGISKQSVRNIIWAGDLAPVHRIGNLLLIPKSAVDAYINKSVVQAKIAA
jgi:excisionase family DNA binding protein